MYPRPPEFDASHFSSSFSLGSIACMVLLAFVATHRASAAQVPLAWADNSTNESGFKLERATGTGSFVQIAVTGSNIKSYVDSSVAANTAYRYRVRAYNSAGNSSYSNIATITVAATTTNTAPTIGAISNRSISEDGTTGAIAVTVNDAQTSAGSLQLTGTSSNPTLVPDASITFGGSGGNRTITVKPAANQSGTATITVQVSDGALSASRTFTLSVSAVNDAPTISNIPDCSGLLGAALGTILFTVGDVDTPAANLKITATSSNQTLLPNAGLMLGGSGNNRTLTLKPAAGLVGSATVSVKVSDGTLSATDTFVLSISKSLSNTAPTISAIADRSIPMNGTTGAIAFSIGDANTPASNLTLIKNSSNLSLVPLSNITLGGSGANRTVTVKPALNRTGWATIWIKVSDGSLDRTEAFVVNVTAPANLTYIDIGAPAIKGSRTINGGSIQLRAGGAAPTLTSDQLYFGYASRQDDAELITRIASLTRANDWTRAGLMFRASTAANAAFISVVVTPARGVVLEYRSKTGASYQRKPAVSATAPQWLRLTRTSDTFYAFTSEDGSDWDLVDYVTFDLSVTALAGLAVTSQNATTTTTAVFDNLVVD